MAKISSRDRTRQPIVNLDAIKANEPCESPGISISRLDSMVDTTGGGGEKLYLKSIPVKSANTPNRPIFDKTAASTRYDAPIPRHPASQNPPEQEKDRSEMDATEAFYENLRQNVAPSVNQQQAARLLNRMKAKEKMNRTSTSSQGFMNTTLKSDLDTKRKQNRTPNQSPSMQPLLRTKNTR